LSQIWFGFRLSEIEGLAGPALYLPSREATDKLLRYENHFERQVYRAMDELERIQRRRRGESVPAPLNINLTSHGDFAKQELLLKPGVPQVVPDPKLKQEMMVKIINLKIQSLGELSVISEVRQLTSTQAEFYPRHFAAAGRDLQRAMDWYLYLREKKL